MLFDEQNQFSKEQAITADAASTNVVKMGNKDFLPEVAFGEAIPIRIQVTEDFATLTSLEIKVQTDDNSSFSSATDIATTGAIPVAKLKAGFVAPIIYVPKGNEGFMRLYYDVTGSSATAGKITAGIVAAHDNSYQDA